MKKIIRNFLNGVALGITETIPGVSGGTIAIILGCYGELIETVNHFTENLRKYIKFLLPFLLGVAAGMVTFSSVINYVIKHFSFPTMTFFIGLIAGIIPLVCKKVKEPGRWFNFKEMILIIIPVLVLLVISTLKHLVAAEPAETINHISMPFMLFIFFAGIVAAAALVIPGVSGSFMLLLFGIYPLVIESVSSLGHLFTGVSDASLMPDIAKVLLPLVLGIIIGFFSMVRLIEKLLKNHNKTTYLIILGLLLGSVYALLGEPIIFQSGVSAPVIILGIETLLLGGLVSFNLGKKRL